MDVSTFDAVTSLAARQHGVVSRSQLHGLGVTAPALRHLVARHLLVPRSNSVFTFAGAPFDDDARVMAACLDVGGVASHMTAAWLHQLEGFRAPDLVDVSVVKNRSTNTSPLARVHTSTNLSDDVVDIGPIPVLTVARTLFSMAALVPQRLTTERLRAAIESTVRTRRASDPWLWWLLEQRRCRGRNGVAVFESLLAERSSLGPTESWLERETLRILRDAGLLLPSVQHTVRSRGRFVARVDFVYHTSRLVIQVDGANVHADRHRQAVDAAQSNELQLLGYRILRFTYDQIVHRPATVVAAVANALDATMAA